jgi:hypothetical protein
VGKELAQKIMSNISRSEEELTNDIDILNGPIGSFFLYPITETEISKQISSLKNTQSSGIDMITSVMLKLCKQNVALPLAHLYNLCMTGGVYPECFKQAIVIPIYKGGDRKLLSNYRPISLLSTLSKVFEKTIGQRLRQYLEEKKFFSPGQFGFRPGLCKQDAILELTNIWSEGRNALQFF